MIVRSRWWDIATSCIIFFLLSTVVFMVIQQNNRNQLQFQHQKTSSTERAILEYVAEKNPGATFAAFKTFPSVLIQEAEKSRLDHCLLLAQAEIESELRPAAVGRAGEIGLFQILPATARIFESQIPFKRPSGKDLGDLANPIVSTRIATAYLRDIMTRKSTLKEVLTEYNGINGRHLHYYRLVMGAYVEILENRDLSCRYRDTEHQKVAQ